MTEAGAGWEGANSLNVHQQDGPQAGVPWEWGLLYLSVLPTRTPHLQLTHCCSPEESVQSPGEARAQPAVRV